MFPASFGNAGEHFVLDLSRLFRAYAEGLAFESPKACKLWNPSTIVDTCQGHSCMTHHMVQEAAASASHTNQQH